MAIGLLSVLKIVPWSDVISTAPAVMDGARKLWDAVSGKPVSGESPRPSKEAAAGAILAGRVDILEVKVADLHSQMLASSELIRALADQNSQLIARIEVYRRGIFWLAAAVSIATVAAVAALLFALAGQGG
ncbi:MAG TPA: hypothetical protein VF811_15195 [Parasulfuritortus sp.]